MHLSRTPPKCCVWGWVGEAPCAMSNTLRPHHHADASQVDNDMKLRACDDKGL